MCCRSRAAFIQSDAFMLCVYKRAHIINGVAFLLLHDGVFLFPYIYLPFFDGIGSGTKKNSNTPGSKRMRAEHEIKARFLMQSIETFSSKFSLSLSLLYVCVCVCTFARVQQKQHQVYIHRMNLNGNMEKAHHHCGKNSNKNGFCC